MSGKIFPVSFVNVQAHDTVIVHTAAIFRNGTSRLACATWAAPFGDHGRVDFKQVSSNKPTTCLWCMAGRRR